MKAHDALRLMVDTYEGRKAMASWIRPPGRPRNVCSSTRFRMPTLLLLSTLWRSEIDRGHGAEEIRLKMLTLLFWFSHSPSLKFHTNGHSRSSEPTNTYRSATYDLLLKFHASVMWSETVGLRTRPVWDQKSVFVLVLVLCAVILVLQVWCCVVVLLRSSS